MPFALRPFSNSSFSGSSSRHRKSLMAKNPSQSPQSPQSPNGHDETRPSDDASPKLKEGAVLALAVGWNLPIVANFCFLFTGAISERTFNLMMACWAATIPFFVLLFAYFPTVQRLVFTGSFEKPRREAAWGVAILWAVLSGLWLYSTLSDAK